MTLEVLRPPLIQGPDQQLISCMVLFPAGCENIRHKGSRILQGVEPEELVQLIGRSPFLVSYLRVVLPVPGIVSPDQFHQVG